MRARAEARLMRAYAKASPDKVRAKPWSFVNALRQATLAPDDMPKKERLATLEYYEFYDNCGIGGRKYLELFRRAWYFLSEKPLYGSGRYAAIGGIRLTWKTFSRGVHLWMKHAKSCRSDPSAILGRAHAVHKMRKLLHEAEEELFDIAKSWPWGYTRFRQSSIDWILDGINHRLFYLSMQVRLEIWKFRKDQGFKAHREIQHKQEQLATQFEEGKERRIRLRSSLHKQWRRETLEDIASLGWWSANV